MRCLAASSVNPDAWRAGFEVGRALAPFGAQALLFFCSIHYEEAFADLLEGLGDGLEDPGILIFGGTGDGILEGGRATHQGLAALALDGGPEVTWGAALAEGVGADSAAAAEACARQASEKVGGADFAFLLADGTRADGSRLVEGALRALTCPLMGGLAGDDRHFRRSFVFAEGRVAPDAVAILAARGPVRVALHAASGFRPLGSLGTVEESEGNEVRRIGGLSAQGFLREQLGKAPGEVDLGIVPLAIHTASGQFLLRTPAHVDMESGAIRAFGAVPQGAEVRVCGGGLEDLLSGVDEALRTTRAGGFQPAGVLAVSCAGRKWLLGDRYGEEVDRLRADLGDIPLAGFLSFGEIGPFRTEDGTYSTCHFHNATLVLGLIGA